MKSFADFVSCCTLCTFVRSQAKNLCTSVNEVVVHGIPRKDVVLKEGDIVGIDFGCFKNGYCGAGARTVAVGRISEDARCLVNVTERALDAAVSRCGASDNLSCR